MTPMEKFNAIRRDVIDVLILIMCGVAFYVSYQDRNTPAQSDACSETSADVFAENEVTQEDANVENDKWEAEAPHSHTHSLTHHSINYSPISEHTVVKSPVS